MVSDDLELSGRKPAGMVLLSAVLLFLLVSAPRAFAFTSGQAAGLVIGQTSLTSFIPGASASQLVNPYAMAFDSSGDLWVSDSSPSRVLEFKAPLSTGEAASVVIGQSSFEGTSFATSPTGLYIPDGIAFDSSGDLWVVDSSNDRVLEYKPPFTTGEAASLVIGQTRLNLNDFGYTNSTALNSPSGLAFDSSGNLWVADTGDERVLEYKAPFSTNEAASLVIGQPNMDSNGRGTSKTGLSLPSALAFDSSGNLWVVDAHRVLEYTAPLSTHEAASIVIGQNSFTNTTSAVTATGMSAPFGIAFDSKGNLWVADRGDNRVLEYPAPPSSFEAATMVIGQASLTSNHTLPATSYTASSLNEPVGLAFDSSGNLWVADWNDGRVLEYDAAGAPTTPTPEFPALAVPIVFAALLGTSLVLLPGGRFRQP